MGRRLTGVVFLIILALLLALSVAIYQKRFVSTVPVTLHTDRVGNQLLRGSDVEIRGVIVGEVRQVSSNGAGASLKLALKPSTVDLIPRNVSAQLLPKTLFGERYVDLVAPAEPQAHIRSGDVIQQDRSSTALAVQQVLDDLLPLLQSLEPAQLNATLNALATALDGRGNAIGANLSRLRAYLQQLDPHLPTLQHDISRLADFADTYNAAAPNLLQTLNNLRTTGGTVVSEQAKLDNFLKSAEGVAGEAQAVLAENQQNLIQLTATSKPLLDLLARYSPEFPCLLKGLTDFEPRLEQAFSSAGPGLHLTVEVIVDRGKYTPGEEPQYIAKSGPDCRGMPDPAVNYPNHAIPDGSKPVGRSSLPGLGYTGDIGVQGSPAETGVLKGLIAAQDGTTPDKVDDFSAVLDAPLLRGAKVRLK
ncbi:MAG TPA: MCE family protein [Mycobacteriales bacterium]|nr:MCE family protein [Mycobacteriales bacterium]